MEKIKLVEKELNPRDARVSLVKLSETGASLFQDTAESFGNAASNLVRNLDTQKILQLQQLIDALK
jgi:DNA-binding MarR family transcriptional regulator